MPFVSPIPALSSEDLWNGETLVTPAGTAWCAVKVGPRCEKQVVRDLAGRTAASFIALTTTQKVYQRRRIDVQTPLFPGYVFAAGSEEQLSSLWRLRNVAATLLPPSQEEFVRDLGNVYRLMLAGVPLTPEEKLQPGEWARITRGSFKGLEGPVLRNSGGMRLIIEVRWLGQGVSVDVTPDMLERVRTAAPVRDPARSDGKVLICDGRVPV